jgi:hypothetical protein
MFEGSRRKASRDPLGRGFLTPTKDMGSAESRTPYLAQIDSQVLAGKEGRSWQDQ